MSLWQVTIFPQEANGDLWARQIEASVRSGILGLKTPALQHFSIASARGFLVQGALDEQEIERIATKLLCDSTVETFTLTKPLHPAQGEVDNSRAADEDSGSDVTLVTVLPRPGVTNPEADSALQAIRLMGYQPLAARTFRQYRVRGLDENDVHLLATKVLANESVEQIEFGPIRLQQLTMDADYRFQLTHIPLQNADAEQLRTISARHQLSLNLEEMQTIQAYFQSLDREPTDIELETIAQTWSEHCSHKTLAGKIEYRDENGVRNFNNMLKETIFAATHSIRKQLGDSDWCVSVFADNAGVIKFDDEINLTFKVETHNRPSAIEPYGGASTGIGGVIRDTLGTGLGARPLCNTDVFCFADPNTPISELPPGVLHPRRVMQGVVSGVRDYGNRMGIPTVNGAVYFDQRYMGNPLVFCGNVGAIPHRHSFKQPQPNDLIVSIGGRTGRDGIHGATFSSAELTEASERVSSGAVQIGNPIVEKMVVDVVLQARDLGLYNAITDCGAGGFSSAVGEMGEAIGAEVWLERAPLKYQGLSYTEIWISEAQERMVCSVPESKWEAFHELCESENVEATVIGKFVPTGQLTLKYGGHEVGKLEMKFLHDGRPGTVRRAEYSPAPSEPLTGPHLTSGANFDPRQDIVSLLGSLNIASKHWIIRQYDHEVLGRSVIKPLVGVHNSGPSDAAVIRPRLDSRRGAVIACGMNPRFGDFDTYHMAASSINEAIRNCVAVGADPSRIAILDNFCWGYTDRPSTLGSLVRAALACQDMAEAYETPFISGKDSLNNEFSFINSTGQRQTISIPPTLLISALGQIDDVAKCVTMDFKQAGNHLFLLGQTFPELGGSHFSLIHGLQGGRVPQVDTTSSKQLFADLHQAMLLGWIRACHDLSEGGLAISLAEMAIAGGLGCSVDLGAISVDLSDLPTAERSLDHYATIVKLFSESNSRFVIEVANEHREKIAEHFAGRLYELGTVTDLKSLQLNDGPRCLVDVDVETLRQAWLQPLDFGNEYAGESRADKEANHE